MGETGIKGEFWIDNINLKDINMQKEFKARGLEENHQGKERRSKD